MGLGEAVGAVVVVGSDEGVNVGASVGAWVGSGGWKR